MNANVFISNTGKGLARAERDSKDHWSVEFLLAGHDIRCLATDPHRPRVVFAGSQGDGILRSDDSGKTWRPAGLSGQNVKSIAVSPTERGIIHAGTKPPSMFVSRDDGATWNELESFRRLRRWWWYTPAEKPNDPYVQAIALSPTDSNVVLAGVEFGAVVRSNDGGRTWSNHKRGALRDCHSMTFHNKDGNRVYEAGGSGFGASFSQDGGITWHKAGLGIAHAYGWACAADGADPDIWYVSAAPMVAFRPFTPMPAHFDGRANTSIFRSSKGERWKKLSGGLPQPLNYMAYALLTDSNAPGHLYAGLSNGDIWHTSDHGDTWNQLPLNLTGIHRSLILLQPDAFGETPANMDFE